MNEGSLGLSDCTCTLGGSVTFSARRASPPGATSVDSMSGTTLA